MSDRQYDLIFVGGGLASCLAAYRLKQLQPRVEVLVLEHAATLGGNHTWSFFPTDLSVDQRRWIEPLVKYRWTSYEVRFPDRRRRLQSGYCSTNSEHFHALMTAELDHRIRVNAEVVSLDQAGVTLSSGERISGRCVIDGRGPQPSRYLAFGFQKFTGQVLQLAKPHGLEGPIIMDATVDQAGDYRFFYTLPLTPDQVLVEDTRYSNEPGLDSHRDVTEIGEYAKLQGWQVAAVVRDEQGVLPITLGGNIDAYWAEDEIPKIGLRGVLFNAATGYSLADAVRTADAIAERPPGTTRDMYEFLSQRSRQHWRSQGFLRLLNRMLFIAARPDERNIVIQRFYGLRLPLIERFYAGRSTILDKMRILTGKPPVAILPAIRCLPESSAVDFLIEETS